MIRRLALTVGFAVLGAVAFEPNAQAQTAESETIMFSGNVGAVWTFSDTQPGTLALLDDVTLGTLPEAGGISGVTMVSCTNDNNEISVATPRQVQAPANFQGSSTAFVSYNDETADSDNGDSFQVPAGESTLEVDMLVENTAGPLPDGVYEYEVTVTATSN